jgi:hypothetical protein
MSVAIADLVVCCKVYISPMQISRPMAVALSPSDFDHSSSLHGPYHRSLPFLFDSCIYLCPPHFHS